MSGILYNLEEFDNVTGNPPYTDEEITDYETRIIPKFENNLVATMTIVTTLHGNINISKLFHLLPITSANVKERGKSKKRITIENHSGPPSSIYSAKYLSFVRGVDRTMSEKTFRNSITIDIQTERKIINAKISTNTVQMCGASHINDGTDVANLIIDHSLYIKSMLNKIKDNTDRGRQLIEIILSKVKGKQVTYKGEKDHLAKESKDIAINDIPSLSKNDKEIVKFFFLYNEYDYVSEYREKLEWIMKVKNIVDDDIRVKNVNSSMVNVNYKIAYPIFNKNEVVEYKLNHNINRFYLTLYLNGEDGMFVSYNNAICQHVVVEIPCVSKLEKTKTSKNKIDYHVFIVYKGGSVTQSGQGGRPMEDAYQRFMRNIYKYKEELEKPEWTIFMDTDELDEIIYNWDPESDSYLSVNSLYNNRSLLENSEDNLYYDGEDSNEQSVEYNSDDE